MEKNYRDWLTIKEYELCYPLEYLEYLDTFEYEDKICVLLDENAIKKIDLLIKKDEEIKNKKFNERIGQTQTQTQNSNPKHENIFCNNGFILFEYILNEYVKPLDKRGRLSDIHFYYWSMYNHEPQLIHQRPERFKEWFFNNYNSEDLGKIKTYNEVENPNRKKHYSNALDWFQTQNY